MKLKPGDKVILNDLKTQWIVPLMYKWRNKEVTISGVTIIMGKVIDFTIKELTTEFLFSLHDIDEKATMERRCGLLDIAEQVKEYYFNNPEKYKTLDELMLCIKKQMEKK